MLKNHIESIYIILSIFLLIFISYRTYNRGKEILSFNLIALTIIFFRFPSFLLSEMNGDEGEWITGATTLMVDFSPWKSVDNNTSGFVSSAFLSIFQLIGFKIDYTLIRIVLVLFILLPCIYIIFIYYSKFFSKDSTFLGVMLGCIFLIAPKITTDFDKDLLIFSSECVPMFFLTIITVPYLCLLKNITPKSYQLLGLGLCAGLIPFAKLQGVPLALFYSLIIICYLFYFKRYVGIFFYILGGILPSILVVFYLYKNNLFTFFYHSYILNNLIHRNVTFSFWDTFSFFFLQKRLFIPFLTLSPLLSVIILFCTRNINKKETYIHLLGWIVAVFCVTKSLMQYVHYAWFMFPPTIILFIYSINTIKSYKTLNFVKIYLILILLFYFLRDFKTPNELNDYMNLVRIDKRTEWLQKNDTIQQNIKLYTYPNERLAIWGWESGEYFVNNSLLRGTRFFHTAHCIYTPNKITFKIYREVYIYDIKQYKPVAFIKNEGTARNFIKISKGSYQEENFPILWNYISQNYIKVYDDDKKLRSLWIRKDRFNEKNYSTSP
jgi:hypothetical protein